MVYSQQGYAFVMTCGGSSDTYWFIENARCQKRCRAHNPVSHVSFLMSGRFPDFTPRNAPSRRSSGRQWRRALLKKGFTVAGTVPDLHRIPFYVPRRRRGHHHSVAKIRLSEQNSKFLFENFWRWVSSRFFLSRKVSANKRLLFAFDNGWVSSWGVFYVHRDTETQSFISNTELTKLFNEGRKTKDDLI